MRSLLAIVDRCGRALGLSADRRGLVRLGLALTALYVIYAIFFPERPERTARHLFGWLGTAAFLLLWGCGARQVHRLEEKDGVPRRLLWGFFVVFAVAAAFIRPFHSSDLHAYVSAGRMQDHYGLNPYVHVPEDVESFEDDALLSETWKDVPCTYGFLYTLVTRAVAFAGGGDHALTIALFKVLNVLVLAAVAWLTLSTARLLGASGLGVALFTLLWSPWVLLHFVSNAHNDIWMALFLVLAVRLTLDGRWWGVVPALIAGALIKHLALVVLPFAWIVLVRKHGWTRATVSTLLGAGLAVLIAWPYATEWRSFRWEQISTILTAPWNSLQAALIYTWSHTVGSAGDAVVTAVRVAFAAAFLLFYVYLWGRRLKAADYDARLLVQDAALVFFVLLCLSSAAWHPWYPGMFLPLVFLLPPEGRLRRLVLWIVWFQMLAFTPLAKARVLEALVMLALPMVAFLWTERRGGGSAFRSRDS